MGSRRLCDQGTAFTSHEFYEFADNYGFSVEHSSPRTPNTNGILAEMLYARPLRTHLTVRTCLTAQQEAAREVMQDHKAQQKVHYDQTSREYEDLYQQQPILVQLDPHKRQWTKATVVELPTRELPRFFIIQTEDGGQYRRNRRWIKPRVTAPDPGIDSDPDTNTMDLAESLPQERRISTFEHLRRPAGLL